MMNQSDLWIVDNFPAFFPEALTPIQVFGIHEELFIQQTHLINSFFAGNQSRAGDGINGVDGV